MKKAFLSLMAAGFLVGSYPSAQAATYKQPFAWLATGMAVVTGFLGYFYNYYSLEKKAKKSPESSSKIVNLATVRKMFSSSLSVSQLLTIEVPQTDTPYDRIAGSMIAGAVGDALGRPTEFIQSVDDLFKHYPCGICSFKDFKHQDFIQGIAPYTDDTAMAKVTARVLSQACSNAYTLEETMGALARAYVHDRDTVHGWAAEYRAPGNTCKKNVHALKVLIANNKTRRDGWWKVSKPSMNEGGCGSVMHAHPFGLIFSHDPEKAVAWAAEHSYLTHGAPMAVAACAAMAGGVAYAVQGKSPHEVVNYMIHVAQKYDGATAQLIEKARYYAQHKKSSEQVYEEFLGWDARSAIAATVYTFLMAPDSPKRAIYYGVHTPGDSDSIASMAGALVGARVGYNRLTAEWSELELNKLEGHSELMNLAQDVSCSARKKIASIYMNYCSR